MLGGNRKFKNLLIYPNFQLRLIGMSMAIAMVPLGLLFVFQYQVFNMEMSAAQINGWDSNHPHMIFLKEFQNNFHLIFLGAFASSLVICLTMGLSMSHQVAGPLVKMRNFFDRVAENKSEDQEIHFRKGDFFRELAESYNKRFHNK